MEFTWFRCCVIHFFLVLFLNTLQFVCVCVQCFYRLQAWKKPDFCFFIENFNDDGFIAVNSFGETWWDNGRFLIPFDEYWNIYSTYAIVDHDDTGKLESLVYEKQYQKAIELGITNWTRPDDPASRREVAVMVYRAMKK